mmetsp:Transcript_362/g.611  ORF Transcript_362/g.611 Transcript_362/m.611 type:complete len:195 (+) Transcript_362:27-611(+)|eukprot:CAMPEP_0184654206 /NCGR_PEP_ID=MMETSP0308-20130426/11926_1 /TAXON_ID=38269 /ORGANISM="Gloeochaete witrockiana, Strain SAG 46.84" /LENGTH=194 /DNA_ID=CAMNT_0027090105 /DNA_START=8 /DNA_END=592 /DNA_ORIENTATION=-
MTSAAPENNEASVSESSPPYPPEFRQWFVVTTSGAFIGVVIGASQGSKLGQDAVKAAGITNPKTAAYKILLKSYQRSALLGMKFGLFMGLFSGVDLGLAYYRKAKDLLNPIAAGCVTGTAFGIVQKSIGPKRGLLFGGALSTMIGGVQYGLQAVANALKSTQSPSTTTDQSSQAVPSPSTEPKPAETLTTTNSS